MGKYKFDGKYVLSFTADGTKEMVDMRKAAMDVRKKLMEKFQHEHNNKRVQLRGWDKIRVGDKPPEHYTKVAQKYL